MRNPSRYLAQACLDVLLLLDDRVDLYSIQGFPLARYGAQYWPTIGRVEGASSRINLKDRMECLFASAVKPHYATWLWIHNEDHGGLSMSTARPDKPEAAPLYCIASLRFRDLAKHFIAKSIQSNVNTTGTGGYEVTPMHFAVSAGHANILSL